MTSERTLSRRGFLRVAGLSTAGVALTGCVPRIPTLPCLVPYFCPPTPWRRLINRPHGYWLQVPPGWRVYGLQTRRQQLIDDLWRYVNPASAKRMKEFLNTPGLDENIGFLAVDLNLIPRPSVTGLVISGIAPLPDEMPAEDVIEFIRILIESDGMLPFPVEVQSLKTGTANKLPYIQGVVKADLRREGLFNAHAVVRALRANDTAYILIVAVPASQATKKKQRINQIIGTLRLLDPQ